MYRSYTESNTEYPSPAPPILLGKRICAIQLLPDGNGGEKMGLLTQLASGATAEICGTGFNTRTVKVRVNGQYYFVFLQDIGEAQLQAGAA
jgi:hypothetical protein